jgi:ASC-1-like (ASCH) protein
MTRRHLSTRPEWEDAIRSGRKTIDARLVADDVADITVGAIIRYPGARVRVKHMRFYPAFGDLLAHEDWHRIDPDAADADGLRRRLENGHEVTVRDSGAVAIEFEPVDEAS